AALGSGDGGGMEDTVPDAVRGAVTERPAGLGGGGGGRLVDSPPQGAAVSPRPAGHGRESGGGAGAVVSRVGEGGESPPAGRARATVLDPFASGRVSRSKWRVRRPGSAALRTATMPAK